MQPHDTTPLRRCTKCGKMKPATTIYFAEDRRRKSGLQSQCRDCQRERAKQWAQNNKERNRERASEWGRTHKERKNSNNRAYRGRHPLRYSQIMRQARITHKENRANYNRRWRIKNRALTRAYWQNYKARKRNAEGSHTAKDVQRQYEAQKRRCYYCGVKVGDTYHVDHVIPLSRGGSNGPENLVIACPDCNRSKSDKMPHEWPQGGRLL